MLVLTNAGMPCISGRLDKLCIEALSNYPFHIFSVPPSMKTDNLYTEQCGSKTQCPSLFQYLKMIMITQRVNLHPNEMCIFTFKVLKY